MKRVKKTKNFTVRQAQNISENLRDHTESYVSISVKSDHFASPDDKILAYGIYVSCDGSGTHEFGTWSDLLDFYKKLMSMTRKEICNE